MKADSRLLNPAIHLTELYKGITFQCIASGTFQLISKATLLTMDRRTSRQRSNFVVHKYSMPALYQTNIASVEQLPIFG